MCFITRLIVVRLRTVGKQPIQASNFDLIHQICLFEALIPLFWRGLAEYRIIYAS